MTHPGSKEKSRIFVTFVEEAFIFNTPYTLTSDIFSRVLCEKGQALLLLVQYDLIFPFSVGFWVAMLL